MKDVARFFRVLADEARLQIVWLLFNHRELCVCDIMVALGITQSKASRHLATLRHAALVTDRKDGAWSYYSVCSPATDLERRQLDLLRADLANHAEAARVLRTLNEWLNRKGHAACTIATTRRRAPTGRDAARNPKQASKEGRRR